MNLCKHCETRLEEMEEMVRNFWYAYDHFGHKLGFYSYRERYMDGINLDGYCSYCRNWYRQRFMNYTHYEARKRGIK